MAELEPVPEDWSRALAVAAHPDDLEYGTASAIARWTRQGKEVTYLLVTDGEAGIASLEEHRAYLDALPEGTLGTDPGAMLRGAASSAGPSLGVQHAVTFGVVPV